jgi:uncharacterized protein (AIM24 family)
MRSRDADPLGDFASRAIYLHRSQHVHSTEVVETLQEGGASFQVLRFGELSGGQSWSVSDRIYALNKTNTRLHQVRVELEDASVRVEAGALFFRRGRLEMSSDVGGIGGFAKKMASKVLTDESAFKPIYQGTGEIFLEPTFGHFALVQLNDERLIVDKGMYYCSSIDLEVGIAKNKAAARHLGGEGWFQTSISGTGVCVLSLPVPRSEIQVVELRGDALHVDGNFALARKGDIEFSVEKSSKSLIGTLTGGEGLLQTFRGTGEVWLAPTQAVYEGMRRSQLGRLSDFKGSSGTAT